MIKFSAIIFPFVFLSISCHQKIFSSSIDNRLLYTRDLDIEAPWFTGPLLATSANTIPPKHVNFEPYLFFFASTASYNSHWQKISHPTFYSLISQNYVQVGINSFMDFQVVPQLIYQFTQGVRSTQIGDLPLVVDFQLLKDQAGTWKPSIKLALKSTAPIAKYEHLNPEKLGSDGAGTGSWLPTLGLAFSKLFHTGRNHFLSLRLSCNYTIPNSVSVKGLNVYGGATDTKGRVYPGNVFTCDAAFEYNLTQNWVLASDLYYARSSKTTFKGNPGTFGNIGNPSSDQLSLAPAIEYNWTINVGLITGAWFTLAGRNSNYFRASVTALNIYF